MIQTCRKKLGRKLPDNPDTLSESSDSELEEIQSHFEAVSSLSSLNESLHAVGESPIKLHSVSRDRKIRYGKRKLQKFNLNVEAKFAKVLQVNEIPKLVEAENENEAALDNIISKMKEKINNPNSTRAQKIQVLTMAPENWSRKKISQIFGVSERLVRDARQQEKDNGVCSLPLSVPRKGKLLPKETIQKVAYFFENNEHSRTMPDMKDRVGIEQNVHQQKRQLLCTLKELHTLFKQRNPDVKIGITKFCELRPKWCVSAGASGKHAVHQHAPG